MQTTTSKQEQSKEKKMKEIAEYMRKKGLIFYYEASFKTIIRPPRVAGKTDLKEIMARYREEMKRNKYMNEILNDKEMMRKLLHNDPLIKLALLITGKDPCEIWGDEVKIGEPLTIFKPHETLDMRFLLFNAFILLENILQFYGRHPKFPEFLKMYTKELNRFINEKSIKRCEIEFNIMDEYPTLGVICKVWE